MIDVMPEGNENTFYSWQRELAVWNCGSTEDVLVLARRPQACEMEEFQQMTMMEIVYLLLLKNHFS